jgi:threonine/homoserine/homoserine lactone efflux protein
MALLGSHQFGVFLAAAVVLAITPGPGVAYVVARTVAGGRREGIASTFGTAVGGGVHVLAAALGLSAMLAQSALAFTVVKYAGACYLIYLGVRTLLKGVNVSVAASVRPVGITRAFYEGVAVEVLNVKTALFFLAFIPQFVDTTQPVLGQFLVLGVVCVVLNTTVDLLAVAGAARLMQSTATRRLRARVLNIGSALTLVGLGAGVALAKIER